MSTTTWTIDAAHTDVTFSAKHMMITTVRGRFGRFEGTLELDEGDPTASRGEIRVAAASLTTGFEARDQHLRSPDFLDADRHEWIVFRATGVERTKDPARFRVSGELEIRAVSRPVAFEVEHHGIVPGMRGGRHAGFTAAARINRKDWGLNWNVALETGGWLVSDEIRLEIELAVDELAPAAQADVDTAAVA